MSEAEQQWYFISVVNQEQYGPYTADQLEGFVTSGSITRETMIWTEILEDQWIPAANVEGLFPVEATPVSPSAAGQPAQPAQPAQLAQPARPQLLTGLAAQTAHPLGTAPVQTPQLQSQPLQAQPLQAAPVQPAAPAPQQRVAPGMIPSTMAGTAQQAVPAGGPLQVATPAAAPGHIVPPGELFPPPAPCKASFGMWIGFWAGGCGLMILGMLIGEVVMILLSMVAGYALVLWSGILSYIYLYRAWSLIQPGNVRVTPGKAIGFLFIPFFNLYWIFVAIGGLPSEWNRVMSSHPNLNQAPRLSSGLAIAACLVPFLFIPLMAGICKGINWMGRLHMMPTGGGPGGPLGAHPLGGTPPQAGGAIRLY